MERRDHDREHAGHRLSGSSGGGAAVSFETDDLLTPGEVARRFGVDPKTVTRWAEAGKLPVLRTLGGHRRYPRQAIDAILTERAG